MKLYNLFESLILEEIQLQRRLLTEGASDEDIIGAINGMYNVNIEYRDYEDQPPSRRFIQVYVYGTTTAGNKAIRAYQIQGGTKTATPGWKMFRTDRIVNWFPTKQRWYNPVSDYDASIQAYNQTGDNTFASIISQVDPSKFGRQRSDISQAPEKQQPQVLSKPKAPEPEKAPMVNKPERPRLKPVEPVTNNAEEENL